jgi:hypothetical protein
MTRLARDGMAEMRPAAISSDFVMYGARAAMAGGLAHIEEQVEGLERAVIENPGLAFDLARTVVESTCRAILTERTIAFDPDDALPQLFRVVTTHLPLLPTAAATESDARRSLARTLGGLHSSLQGVCELRNSYGFASHGAGAGRPAMEGTQALLAAQTADAIVGFLHGVHRQDHGRADARAGFSDNEAFNTYIDDANDVVQIFELTYRPSEVLFSIDEEAYRDLLANYPSDRMDLDGPSGSEVGPST